jgi:hypothetical protein
MKYNISLVKLLKLFERKVFLNGLLYSNCLHIRPFISVLIDKEVIKYGS